MYLNRPQHKPSRLLDYYQSYVRISMTDWKIVLL